MTRLVRTFFTGLGVYPACIEKYPSVQGDGYQLELLRAKKAELTPIKGHSHYLLTDTFSSQPFPG